MKDNISIILVSIIAVLLIVIIPFISILDRQDMMSYNVVLTKTKSFVETVRSQGFLTKDEYDNYLYELSKTGNTYKVELEVHKQIKIKTVDSNGTVKPDEYSVDTLIYYTKDVLKKFEINSDIYEFEEGDLFYVHIYNTNITSANVIYNYVSGVIKEKVIDISYGGYIKTFDNEKYEATVNAIEKDTAVTLSIPVYYNKIYTAINNTRDIVYTIDPETGETIVSYEFNISNLSRKGIKIFAKTKNLTKVGNVSLKNLSELSESNKNDIKNKLKESIILTGFYSSIEIENLDVKKTSNDSYEVNFDIFFPNIVLDNTFKLCYITLAPGFGENEYKMASGKDSNIFYLKDEYGVHKMTISGPYIIGTNNLYPLNEDPSSLNFGMAEINNITTNNFKVKFIVDFSLISIEATEIKQLIEENIYNNLNSPLIKTTVNVSKNSNVPSGQINIEITHEAQAGLSFSDTYKDKFISIMLPEAWTTVMVGGMETNAQGFMSRVYTFKYTP